MKPSTGGGMHRRGEQPAQAGEHHQAHHARLGQREEIAPVGRQRGWIRHLHGGHGRAYKGLAAKRKSPRPAALAMFMKALLCGAHEAPIPRRAAACSLAAPAASRRPLRPPPQAPAPKDDLVPVAIDTSLGRIVVALDRGRAPITTANFLHYVDTHRFDGENFYRAMHMPSEGGRPDPGRHPHRRAQALSADRARADQPDRASQCRRHDLHGQCWRRAPPGRLLHPAVRHAGPRRRTVPAATPTASPPSATSSKAWTS